MNRTGCFLTAFIMIVATTARSGEKQSLIAPGAKLEKLAGGFKFTEGPAVNAMGNIFFTDIPNDRIHKWSLDGKLLTFREDSGGANGLFLDKNGNLVVCEGTRRRLVSISMQGKVTILADKYKGKLLNSPNDLWIDPKGGIYFTDPVHGLKGKMEQDGYHVYYLLPDRKKLIRVINNMVMPNGIIGTPDGKLLYVTDLGGEKTFVYTVNKDGTLANTKLFAPEGSDGMTIDNEGNVYLTTSVVAVYNKKGQKIEVINVPERPNNVCFGGKNRDVLFITARTSLYSVRMRVKAGEMKEADLNQRVTEALLPKELAPDVHVLCASHRFGSATVGWITFGDESILIDCPHPDYLPKILAKIESTTGKPLKRVILTHSRQSQLEAAQELLKRGVRLYAEHQTALLLKQALPSNDPTAQAIRGVSEMIEIRGNGGRLELHPLGHASGPGNLAVLVRHRNILFAGEVCSNGPRNDIPRGHNKRWIEALGRLEQLSAETVVPAFGGIGDLELLRRQKDFLVELRRRVSYLIAMSKPRDFVVDRLKLHSGVPVSPTLLYWFPYGVPKVTDIEHLYDELTVPSSPYKNHPFAEEDGRPRALALIGDRVHDPAQIEENLGRAFSDAGVAVRFAFDVRALSAENLKQVHIFCILRDGAHWPEGIDKNSMWMTPDQEKAIVDFVNNGGALLGLHNCPGLFPKGGPYLELLGGTYKGHGPMERFRVKVHDPEHPITRGVESYEVADEQHTPIPNLDKVHIFLKSYSEDGVEAAAGWAYDVGKGRVCYLANGHTRESLTHPMVQLLLRNAINWCLKRETEEAGK